MRSAVLLLLLLLLALATLCQCEESPSSTPNSTTVLPTTSAPPLKGSKWGLVVVCVCGGVLVIAGTIYAVSEIRECCAAPPPSRRGATDEHGHSHDEKKKKKEKEHGHSHDEKKKKDKKDKEKHGHSHDEKKKSKAQKQDAEKQSLLAGEGAFVIYSCEEKERTDTNEWLRGTQMSLRA